MPLSPSSVESAFTVPPIDGQAPTDSGINSPDLSPKTLKPGRRSLTDISQAFSIIEHLTQSRRDQNAKNAKIQAKLNSERPYDDAVLQSEGLGYKSNFSTKPLSTTVGKVASRLTKSIQSARYLTSSQLPDSVANAKEKSEFFRDQITNCIRRWPGWYNFVNEVASEDSTYGWTTVTWFDRHSWKPVHFRQDEAFLPDGTKHSVDTVQFAAFRQFIFPHELADFVSNRQAAEDAGWEIDNVVDAINHARIQTAPSGNTAPHTDSRRYEDALRESSVSLSLTGGAKQIEVWHILATEIDGKITHMIGDGNSKKLLFQKDDLFDRIEDCAALLSYEQGNGKLMGSKGIGREIYELASVLDRARNEVVDRLQLSGKILVQGDENQISRFKLTVVSNVALIPTGFVIQQNKIESSVKEFAMLDQLMTGLLDQIAGGVTPKTFERERVTKAEVELFASREEEKRDDIATRFVTQLANGVISGCQRRIASKTCTDEDAKLVRQNLLTRLSEEELEYLANQPALRTIEDYTDSEAQKIVLFAQEKRQDPLYNQYKLQKRAASALVNSEFAEDVLLPENDPTETAEQTRLQTLENLVLGAGGNIPVSPRDNHIVHAAVIKQTLPPIAQGAGSGDPKALQALQAFVQHWAAHLNAALAAGIPKAQLDDDAKQIADIAKHIGELQAEAQQHAQNQQTANLPIAPAGPSEHLPVTPPGQDPSAQPAAPAAAPAPAAAAAPNVA